jgi:hypothetical protein
MPDEVGGSPEGHPVGMSPASCRRAGALMVAPCPPGQPLSVPAPELLIQLDKRIFDILVAVHTPNLLYSPFVVSLYESPATDP